MAKALLPEQPPERRRDFQERRTRSAPPPGRGVFRSLFHKKKKPSRARPRPYSFIYTLLNPYSKKLPAVYFKIFITSVILWDSFLFIFGTDERIYQQNPGLFSVSEGLVSCIFALEYILRLYTCTERPKYQNKRLEYMLTPAALIDLFATLPYFLELLIPNVQLPTLTYLRVFRLARILKTAGFIRAMDAVYRVIYYNREVLYVALWMCLALTLGTSILLYTLRPMDVDRSDLDNLDDFHSIPATLYMATLMLTGQGGPDADDLPWYTRSVILITAVFSVAMFAIPASMLTWGFEAGKLICISLKSIYSPLALLVSVSSFFIIIWTKEAERMAKRSRKRALKERERSERGYSSTSSDENDEQSSSTDTDEEYFRIIAGEDPAEEETATTPEEMEQLRKLKKAFSEADSDFDG